MELYDDQSTLLGFCKKKNDDVNSNVHLKNKRDNNVPESCESVPEIVTAKEKQKLIEDLGQIIFNFVHAKHPSLSSKITGMLIADLEPNELERMIENKKLLCERMNLAIQVLEEYKTS